VPVTETEARARATSKQTGTSGIKHIVAVASGKGGVGKSTTSCNLALGFAALGLKVGILDADIYGPSQPKLSGLRGKPRFPHPIFEMRSIIPLLRGKFL
jgi:ATP-binding protein involved in chromosome partitioning